MWKGSFWSYKSSTERLASNFLKRARNPSEKAFENKKILALVGKTAEQDSAEFKEQKKERNEIAFTKMQARIEELQKQLE